MELGLKGKTVIVTGGGSNIGRGIAMAFAKEGSNVVIADIDEPQGARVVTEADALKAGGRTILVKTDVSKAESWDALVKKTLETFGRIDVLVNNVGWTRDVFFMEKPISDFEKEIALNYWSVIFGIRAVVPPMREKKQGKIVNIASDAGRVGEPREAVYSGCKAGVIGLTKALAKEHGRDNININVVCPAVTVPTKEQVGKGSMWTEETFAFMTKERQEAWAKQYPLRRLGRPEDIASAVLFFASDAASYITGQTLSVNGGFSML